VHGSKRLVLTICSFALLTGLSQAGTFATATPIRPMQGHVVEARATAASTLFLWDATPYVIALVHDRVLGNAGLRAIQATGATALAQRAKAARSRNVVLRILYQKTGAVNPAYGAPTFEGVEVVAVLSAPAKQAVRNGPAWAAQLAQGRTPKGLTVQILGRLPPQTR
jgi:hypothetical protein